MLESIAPFGNHLPIRIRFGEGVVRELPGICAAEGWRQVYLLVDPGVRDLYVEPMRQVFADFDELRRNQVKVVEEPLRSGRDEGAFAGVLRECLVGDLEGAFIVAQTRIDAARVAALGIEREVGGQRERALIQPLGTQRFVTKRFAVPIGWRR